MARNPVVSVIKPNGNCLDMWKANVAIERERNVIKLGNPTRAT